ncbi:MAG: peptidase S10 [Chloroflexi bacterium]|nr:peptidase S10 [Chloroflexota bacterium]
MPTQPEVANKAPENKPEPTKPDPKDELVVTEHTITVNGQTLHYTVTTGTIVMKNDENKATAAIFFIAYTKKDEPDSSKRPLTISFNGGPGSSSVWLHLGLLGPRRVVSGDVDQLQPPPYRLVDNEHTLLTETDLVFIDPVSTGYSRAVEKEKAKDFHGLEKDIESVGEFIRLYVTRYKRWNSPKFLIGESYGTTRAAGLAGHLQEQYGMYLNGLMLVSSILNFQTALFTTGNDLPYILYLPTYAATAFYHGKLAAHDQSNLQDLLIEVQTFALTDYTLALMQGDKLAADTRTQIVEKLARYTGLSPAYIEQVNLRIEIFRFTKELLRDQRRTVGRLDSRFKGIDRDPAGEQFQYDPSYSAIQGPYSATLNHYVRSELNFESDLPYELLANLYESWDYSKHQNEFVNVADTLRAAMTQNPFLKVIVANGYYDFATPYFATEYTFTHLELDESLRHNISMTYYEAGHMMYVHEPSLAQLNKDLAAFVRAAIASSLSL